MFNLKQRVSFSTHSSGHTLDLLIILDDCFYIFSIFPCDFISDHRALVATLKKSSIKPINTIKYRQYNKIDFTSFMAELMESDLIKHLHTNASYNQYHTALTNLVNCHSPIKTKSVPTLPPNPWI